MWENVANLVELILCEFFFALKSYQVVWKWNKIENKKNPINSSHKSQNERKALVKAFASHIWPNIASHLQYIWTQIRDIVLKKNLRKQRNVTSKKITSIWNDVVRHSGKIITFLVRFYFILFITTTLRHSYDIYYFELWMMKYSYLSSSFHWDGFFGRKLTFKYTERLLNNDGYLVFSFDIVQFKKNSKINNSWINNPWI